MTRRAVTMPDEEKTLEEAQPILANSPLVEEGFDSSSPPHVLEQDMPNFETHIPGPSDNEVAIYNNNNNTNPSHVIESTRSRRCSPRFLFRLVFCNAYARLVFHKDRRAYFWVWMSGFVAQIGDYFNFVSTLSLINSLTAVESQDTSGVDSNSAHGASGFVLSGLFLSYCVVPMLLLPFTGVVADKLNKRHVMIIADLVRVGVMGCFVALASVAEFRESTFNSTSTAIVVGLIYLLNSITFAADAFFGPCREGLVPALVPAEELPTANALDSITYTSASSLGSSLGGLITSIVGIHAGYIINGIAFLLSAFCIFMAKTMTPLSQNSTTHQLNENLEEAADKEQQQQDSPSESQETTGQQEQADNSSDFLSAANADDQDGNSSGNCVATENRSSLDASSDSALFAVDPEVPHISTANQFTDHTTPTHALFEQQQGRLLKTQRRVVHLRTILLDSPIAFVSSFLDGLRFLWRHKFVAMLVIAKGMGAACWGAIDLDNVRFATDEFQLGGNLSTTLGLIYTVQGLACGLAPVLVERILPLRNARADRGALLSGFVCLTAGISLISWSPHILVFLLGNAITSAGVGISWVYSTTILQQVLPTRLRGRIFSLDFAMHAFGEILSLVWSGVAFDVLKFSPQHLAFSVAIVSAVFLACWFVWALFTCGISKHEPLEQLETKPTTAEDECEEDSNICAEEDEDQTKSQLSAILIST